MKTSHRAMCGYFVTQVKSYISFTNLLIKAMYELLGDSIGGLLSLMWFSIITYKDWLQSPDRVNCHSSGGLLTLLRSIDCK